MQPSRYHHLVRGLSIGLITGVAASLSAQTQQQFTTARSQLVREVIVRHGIKDRRVIRSIQETRRHEFVPLKLRGKAYFDMALPIGDRQTISSPFIVAFMTQALDAKPTDKVLEIGTGSGYQAAVLSPLVREVYTIEIVPALGRRAAATLKRLKYTNVFTRIGDGFQGWSSRAPFDKIIVTCSPEKVPQPLVDQLREGGLMVVPVGERYQQTLYLLQKRKGKLESVALRPTLFVPMTGRAETGREIKPDPLNPRVVNGDFEQKVDKNGFVAGWYYQRQAKRETADDAPQGSSFVTFHNEDAGRHAHLLQGFAVNGRELGILELTTWLKYEQIDAGQNVNELPMAAVSFYDQNRKELGMFWLGPFRGNDEWHQRTKRISIPRQARHGILRIGLFGATGSISFDQIRIAARRR